MTDFDSGTLEFHLRDGYRVSVALGDLRVQGWTSDWKEFSFSISFDNLQSGSKNEIHDVFTARGSSPSRLAWQFELIVDHQTLNAQWRIKLQNESRSPVFIDRMVMLDQSTITGQPFCINGSSSTESLSFYSNGWQSWSTTGSYQPYDRMRRTRLGFLQAPMVINPDTPVFREKSCFSSDFFSLVLDKREQCGFVLGFLSQRQHFGSITADFRDRPVLRMWANGDHARLDPGQSITTDWAVIYPFQVDLQDPFEQYLNDVAAEHQIGNFSEPPVGWCSWYYYYQGISERIIEENVRRISESNELLPLDLIQIDDGFESQVGDWLDFNKRFPNGVKPLAEDIQRAGFEPGLWLAPFILHPRARTAREHPDWLLRKQNGGLVRTGFVWNSLGAALDLTHPGVMDYVREVIHTAVHDWGFPYLKLDFLYAAALKGAYQDKSRTRAQVLRSGMEAVRDSAGPDTRLVGCGAPLGSMLGLVDAMRIGPDVNKTWEPSYDGISFPFRDEPCVPSARNSIRNILTRSPLHNHWWVNDPDCLLVRPDSRLTLPEIQSLATAIAMTGGSLLVSDDMTQLPEERQRIVASLLPMMNLRAQVIDLLETDFPAKLRLDLEGVTGSWHLLARFNWNDYPINVQLKKQDFGIDEGDYFIRSFWDRRTWCIDGNDFLYDGKISAHGVALLALRKNENSPATYLGSDLHISQGLEVSSWNSTEKHLEFQIKPGKKMAGSIDLKMKSQPLGVKGNSQILPVEFLGENTYHLQIPEVETMSVNIAFK